MPERDRAFREALAAAARGWRVVQVYGVDPIDLTCRCGGRHERDRGRDIGKHPIGKNWPERATADVEALRRAENAKPGSNYGVKTGERLVVLDLDEGGERAIVEQESVLGPLPATVRVLTGGGGEHRLFSVPADCRIPNRVRLLPGVDIRGHHGQAVLPGSLHRSGRRYAWAPGASPDEVALAELPAAWLRLLTSPHDDAVRDEVETGSSSSPAARRGDDHTESARSASQSANQRLDDRQRAQQRHTSLPPVAERIERARAYLARLGPAVSGTRGWHRTIRAVIAVVRGLAVPERDALALLGEWNANCRPPWSEQDLRDKIEWATKKAKRLGRPGFMLGRKIAITSRPAALEMIARVEAAVVALPTAGRTADSDRAQMMALIDVAKRTGSVVVAMAGRTGAERGRVHRPAARAALGRLVAAGMVQRAAPPAGTRPGTAAYELLPPERWCRFDPVPKGHLGPDRYWVEVAPVGEPVGSSFASVLAALDADLFRRSYGGQRGLGPKAKTLLAALLVADAPVNGPREAKRMLPALEEWAHTTVSRIQVKLAAAGLVDGWRPVGDLSETLVVIAAEEERRGLAGATDRQRKVHRSEREAREERLRSMASAVELVLARHGAMTVAAAAAALGGTREATVFEALQWLKAEKRVVCRSSNGSFVWSVTGDAARDALVEPTSTLDERAELEADLSGWVDATDEPVALDVGAMHDAAGPSPMPFESGPRDGREVKLPERRHDDRADAGGPRPPEHERDRSRDRPIGALLGVLRDRTGAPRIILERATLTEWQDGLDRGWCSWDELDDEVDEDAA